MVSLDEVELVWAHLHPGHVYLHRCSKEVGMVTFEGIQLP
jgi:hypothetical protein